MSDWTEDDTTDLREMADAMLERDDAGDVHRAAAELDRRGAEIERLAARVSVLESDLARVTATRDYMRENMPDSIPREELVRALLAWSDRWCGDREEAATIHALVRDINTGTFPPKESTP
jgi:hypothetical protein